MIKANRDLLIHFLNAILGAELPRPITAVEIQNPYNEKKCLDDKLTVVDVKARDATALKHDRVTAVTAWAGGG